MGEGGMNMPWADASQQDTGTGAVDTRPDLPQFIIKEHTILGQYMFVIDQGWRALVASPDGQQELVITFISVILPAWLCSFGGGGGVWGWSASVSVALFTSLALFGCRRVSAERRLNNITYCGIHLWPTWVLVGVAGLTIWTLIGVIYQRFWIFFFHFISSFLLLIGGEVAIRAIIWKLNIIPSFCQVSDDHRLNRDSVILDRNTSGGGMGGSSHVPTESTGYIPPTVHLLSSQGDENLT